MITGAILAIVCVLLLICVGVSLLRGLAKARIRGIMIVSCAFVAILITLLAKSAISSGVTENVIPALNDGSLGAFSEIYQSSVDIAAIMANMAGALISPLFCLVVFLALMILTWIVYLILALALKNVWKRMNQKANHAFLRNVIWAVAGAFVVIGMFLMPISVYAGIGAEAFDAVAEAEILDANTSGAFTEIQTEYVDAADDNFLIVTHRALGGNLVGDLLTNFRVGDQTVSLRKEIGGIAGFGSTIVKLSQSDFAQYSEKEAELIRKLANRFGSSQVITVLSGELIYSATDAWMHDEAYAEIEKPSVGEGEASDLFSPFMNTVFSVLHDDSKIPDNLKEDFTTVADVISVMASKGVFQKLGNTEDLVGVLGGDGVVTDVIRILGENERMKALIPEITNMGLRAIATTLGLPEDVSAVYGELLDDVAVALNEYRDDLTEESIDQLTEKLVVAFDEAGVPIDSEIISCYSVSMIQDLVTDNDQPITSEDVQAFFENYALAMAQEIGTNDDGTIDAPVADTETVPTATVYDRFPAKRANSGAAALAKVTFRLSDLTADDPEMKEKASAILKNIYTELFKEENPTAVRYISNVTISSVVSKTTLDAATSLRSAEEVVTTKITLDVLLVDVKKAAEQINSETVAAEAESISSVFNAAGDLLDATKNENFKLEDVATSFGTILDAMQGSVSVGSDLTATLFTAVLQSEQIRSSANLDMKTATLISIRATEGEVSYSQTMNTVSKSITIMNQLNDGEEISEEELVEMIRNLTPQTAGVIEVYVDAERVQSYGVPAENADLSAKLVSTTFSYLAHEEIEDFDAEAKALNHLLSIAIAARDSHDSDLFGGTLPTAQECIDSLMASKAVCNAAVTVLTDGQKVIESDPCGLADRMEANPNEKKELTDAVIAYHNAHPETDVLTLKAITALFGIQIELN